MTGADVMNGITSVTDTDASNKAALGVTTGDINENELQAAFCGACHNKNVNWDRGGSGAEGAIVGSGTPPASEGERPSSLAHALGTTDGLIDVYGKLKSVATALPNSCRSCHRSSLTGTVGSFPHQTKGHKFLDNMSNTYGDVALNVGESATDPYRTLPQLDNQLCRTCHTTVGDAASSTSF